MKKLKLFLSMLMLIAFSVGNVWAVDYELIYTLDGSVTKGMGNSNYAEAGDGGTQDGIKWYITGNTTMDPWRIGGKNLSGADRTLYSATAMSGNVAKIEIQHNGASSVTVNSMKVEVASNADFSTIVSTLTPTFVATGTVEVTRPAGKDWSNCFYRITYNVTIGSSNKFIAFVSAKFYKEAEAAAFAITATTNNESYGTVALSGSVITATPKEGCRIASTAYTVKAGSATVVRGTGENINKFTVTPTSDCTIQINFEEIPSYTVTWNVNGDESRTSSVSEGSKPVFPTPAPTSCDASSTTFVGWATGAWAGKVASVTAETLYTTASAMPAVTGAVTYYAVFAHVEGGGLTTVLDETFDACDGTGGNDGSWSGSIASGTLAADYNGWTLVKQSGANECAKFGTTSALGSAQTPSLAITSTATLTFRAGAWSGGSENTTLKLSATGATLDKSSVELTKGAFTEHTVAITEGTGAVTIKFEGNTAANSRFFLDDVLVVANSQTISDYMTTCAAAGQCAAPTFSVAGGTYNAAQSVELSCETDGATIHYTTNGDAPTSSSATYSSAIAVNENMTIKAIAVKDGSTDSEVAEAVYVLKPATPEIAGSASFVGATNVTITCETEGVEIRYTTNGDDPTASSTLYSAPFAIDASCTVKAIAVKTNWTNSDAASKEFTKHVPLTTMDEIFSAASSAGNYYITFSEAWVVTGVSTNGKNVYISDGTKGMILYNNSANMELAVGNTLSGTVQRSLKLYNGAAELDAFTTEGLTKGTADLPAVQVLDAEGVAALSGVNTGSLIKINGAATQSETKYYVAGVQLYNALSTAYTNPTAGKNYYVTGVYAQYNTTKEVMPRSAEDVEEMKYQLNYILPAQGTLSIKQNETHVNSGTQWVEGTQFTLSSTAPSDDYKAGVYTVTDWGEPANDVTADVLSGNTLTMPKYNVIVTVAFAEKTEATAISWSNSGAAVNVHIDNTDDLPTLTKGGFTVTCNSSDENVATVDNDGVVTMVGAGTTTISAVFAGDDDYKATTVSYELTILPDFYIAGNFTSWGDNKIPVAGESKTINLAAGSYELKVVTTADEWKGFENLDAATVVSGIYTTDGGDANICFKLDAASNVTVSYVGGKISLVGNFAEQEIKVAGDAPFTWDGAVLELAENKLTASKTFTALEAKSYAVKMINGGSWLGNGGTINRENPSTLIVVNGDNMSFVADMAGEYTFTWTFATRTLTVTYPALPEKEYYVAGSFTNWETGKVKMTTTDDETWTATIALEADKTGANKYEFKIIETQLADTWLGLENAASMVYGNCTDWTIGGGGANIGLETTKAADYTFTYVPATKKLSVNIPQKEAGISWNASTATAYTKGKSYELPTLSNPNGLLVELSSSNEAVAYLDEGQLKIAGAGTATITATSAATGVYAAGEASYTLTVLAPASVVVTGDATKKAYEAGETFSFAGLGAKATYADEAEYEIPANEITWAPAPAPVINANGNVNVTATWESLTSAVKSIPVTVNTYAVTFEAPANGTLVVKNGGVAISSGDAFAKGTVLTVEVELESADYVLATLTANTTDIKATKQFTIGEVDVTIEATSELKPVAPISWSAESASIAMNGDVATLPTLVNEQGLGIRYMSNNEEAATINENTGVITLVGAGVTTITAQSIATEEGAYRTTFVTYTLTVVAIPTALDNTEAGEKAQKIMLNNQLFILRGGKMYDAQGKLVK